MLNKCAQTFQMSEMSLNTVCRSVLLLSKCSHCSSKYQQIDNSFRNKLHPSQLESTSKGVCKFTIRKGGVGFPKTTTAWHLLSSRSDIAERTACACDSFIVYTWVGSLTPKFLGYSSVVRAGEQADEHQFNQGTSEMSWTEF